MQTNAVTEDQNAVAESGSIQAFFAGRGSTTFKMIDRGEGIYIWDTDGKRYLDGSSGAVVNNLGYGNPYVLAAMKEQAEKCCYAVRTIFASESMKTFSKRLARLSGFDQVFPVSGGSESIEAAIKLARQYAIAIGQPERCKVLARMPGYHGATLGAAAVTGDPDRDKIFGPMMRIMPKVPAPFNYRVPDNHTAESYERFCLAEFENTILREGPESVLAFVMEPVGGVATGALVSSAEYYRSVRQICDKYGVLLIYDEVMCGVGRTGKFLAAHHWPDATPDLAVLAKGLGAGYVPLGAMLAPNKIVDAVVAGGGFLHGHTYAGNPLACAVGNAVLEEFERMNLMENAHEMGILLRDRLHAIASRNTVIGDVRGVGLLNAIEIVKDQETKEVFPSDISASYRLVDIAREKGLIGYSRRAANGIYGEWLLIAPPLIITSEQVDEYAELLEDTITTFEREIGR